MMNYYVYALFFATIAILSIRKKNSKISKYYGKEEHKK